jgi:Nucleoside transporter
VSLANFVAACWEDPTDFHTAHCGDTLTAPDIAVDGRLLLLEQKSPSCSPYQHVNWSVFLYFFLGSAVLVACIVGYTYIGRFREMVERRDEYETVHSNDASMHTSDSYPRVGLELHGTNARPETRDGLHLTDEMMFSAVGGRLEDISNEPDAVFNERDPANETAAVWLHVKGPATCIFLTFFVTLSLFPGWTSDLRSVHQCHTRFRLANDLYIPFGFLLFNVGDLVRICLCVCMRTRKRTLR